LSYFCRMVSWAREALSSSGKRPKTVAPLPVIKAAQAPNPSSSFLMTSISGYRLQTTSSRSFTKEGNTVFSRGRAGLRGVNPRPKINGMPFVVNGKFSYTQRVATGKPGLTKTIQPRSGRLTPVNFSPIPVALAAVCGWRKKGMSAPSLAPNSASRLNVHGKPSREFKPLRTAAASLLPPPRPAATGIFLERAISTPVSSRPVSLKKNFAARTARFRSSSGRSAP